MLLQHALVIHLVDVVAGQQHHVTRVVIGDDVDVLVHRVGGAEVPVDFGDTLRGRQDVEALVAFGAQEGPAALQVADQGMRLVLRGDRQAPNARVQRVGQGEVDDARLATEIDSRLGAAVGQLHQARAAAAGQHEGHGVACQRAAIAPGAAFLSLWHCRHLSFWASNKWWPAAAMLPAPRLESQRPA